MLVCIPLENSLSAPKHMMSAGQLSPGVLISRSLAAAQTRRFTHPAPAKPVNRRVSSHSLLAWSLLTGRSIRSLAAAIVRLALHGAIPAFYDPESCQHILEKLQACNFALPGLSACCRWSLLSCGWLLSSVRHRRLAGLSKQWFTLRKWHLILGEGIVKNHASSACQHFHSNFQPLLEVA